jgi:hypothetical protein
MLQNYFGPIDGFGFVNVTVRAHEVLSTEELWQAFNRPTGRGRNRFARQNRLQGCRLLEERRGRHGLKFWIITEADHSRSTLMMPGEPLISAQ